MRPHETLARRLINSMFPWFLLITFGLALAQVAVQYLGLRSAIKRDLASLCRVVEQPVAEAVWELDKPTLARLALGIRQNAIVTGLEIVGVDGQTLLADGDVPAPQAAGSADLGVHAQGSVPLYFLTQRGSQQLVGHLRIHSSPSVVWERMRSSLFMSLLSSIALAAGMWLLFSATIRSQVSKSVQGLADTIAGWRSQPLDQPAGRIEYPHRDELGSLVDALNESRSRLYESMRELNALNRDQERVIALRTADLQEAKERAEAADRIKSAFLATMSHELRTPLNSIIGFTGILIQGLVGPLNDEQTKQLGMVRDSSIHLLDLINDVLDISKIEAGQLEVASVPFDLRDALEKAARTLRVQASRKGLDLELAVDPGIGTLTGDRRRVEQVLLNLIGNAIKFTEQGGVNVHCEDAGDEARVLVRDTGIGIRAEDLPSLFRPFRQVDSGTARKYDGTGLGLSICKRLVELMGGRIWVESVPGSGSIFGFALPKRR